MPESLDQRVQALEARVRELQEEVAALRGDGAGEQAVVPSSLEAPESSAASVEPEPSARRDRQGGPQTQARRLAGHRLRVADRRPLAEPDRHSHAADRGRLLPALRVRERVDRADGARPDRARERPRARRLRRVARRTEDALLRRGDVGARRRRRLSLGLRGVGLLRPRAAAGGVRVPRSRHRGRHRPVRTARLAAAGGPGARRRLPDAGAAQHRHGRPGRPLQLPRPAQRQPARAGPVARFPRPGAGRTGRDGCLLHRLVRGVLRGRAAPLDRSLRHALLRHLLRPASGPGASGPAAAPDRTRRAGSGARLLRSAAAATPLR